MKIRPGLSPISRGAAADRIEEGLGRSAGIDTKPALARTTPGNQVEALQAVQGPKATRPPSSAAAKAALAIAYGGAPLLAAAQRVPPGSALGQALVAGHARFGDDDAGRAAALLSALRPFVQDGALDHAALAAAGGAELSARLGALSAKPRPTNWAFLGAVVDKLALGPRDEALAVVDAFLRDDAILPRSVPALDAVKAATADDRFVDEGVVAAQHLLPTSLAFFEALLDKGMKPSRVHVLGTPYASNPLVVSTLKLLGCHAVAGRDSTASTVWLEEQRINDLHAFLHESLPAIEADRPPRGYAILDDGGLLHGAIAHEKVPSPGYRGAVTVDAARLAKAFPPGTRAVEQTTRGITELKKSGARYPTVTVASSRVKQREGEVIGWALAESYLMELLHRGKLEDVDKVAVVSGGTVGIQAAEQLRALGVEVRVIDRDPKKREAAAARGFEVAEAVTADSLAGTQAVMSATGKLVLNGPALADYDGLVLSGSSMAIEGNLDEINAARASPLKVGNLLRPANFTGDGSENVDARQIGIPRALNFAALAQEAPDAAGFYDVDAKLQDITERAWTESGGADLPALEVPKDPPRPDLDAGARHDEWMSFLMASPRPVSPPPNAAAHLPGRYFFEDDAGQVRVVDTSRPGAVSRPVALPSVPEQTWPLSSEGGPEVLACRVGGALQVFEYVEGQDRPTRVGTAKRFARAYVADHRNLHTGQGPIHLGLAFVTDEGVLAKRPQAARWERVKVDIGDDDLVTWPHKDGLLIVEKEPARLKPALLEDSFFARMTAGRAKLPAGMTRVDQVSTWEAQHSVVLVGRADDDRVLIAGIAPQATEVAELPRGAIFRGLRPGEENLWGRFVASYTLPGDPAELEHYREAVIDFMPGIS